MYEQREKPKGNKSRSVVNPVSQKKSNVMQQLEIMDNRPHSEAHKFIQRMKTQAGDKASEVTSTTHDKHVKDVGSQAADAQAGYGPKTYVTSDSVLTSIVDADPYQFAEANGVKSARKLITNDVVIYQYEKTNAKPAGWAKGEPVHQTINGESKLCEIGVTKGGDEKLKIDHFRYII